jgi:hypothetical protein
MRYIESLSCRRKSAVVRTGLILRSLAVATLVLAGTLTAAEIADAKYLVVPWVNKPATPAMLESQLPKPLPTPKPKTDAPLCTLSQLVELPPSGLQWMQNIGIAIRLRNIASSACLLKGTPSVVASSSGHPNVVATPRGLRATDGEVADTPAGATVYSDVSVPVICATDPGGSEAGLPAYHSLVVTLPGGHTWTISGLKLYFPCGLQVTPFIMPTPPVRYPPYWLQYLVPRVSLPNSVKAGGTLAYEITLKNPLNRPVSLSPCPLYIEHSTNLKLEYQLNCSIVRTIPAHGYFIYRMKMAIPGSTPPGPLTVYWSVIGPNTIQSRATVNVR